MNDIKVAAIGGGTGLSTMLRGLKKFTGNITAIVTVADDGGGSGVLREELGMLPPGDIRSCLVALSNVEPSMERLMSYRFQIGSLKGQSFGNLFLAAMNDIYGDFEKAVRETSNVLAVTGRVLPMTLENVKLCAKLENGDIIKGESIIPAESMARNSGISEVFLEPECDKPLFNAIDAILNADIITLGPGSLFTSVIPNLLVKGIAEAISQSDSIKIYVMNIMTQPGETTGMGVKEHLEHLFNVMDIGTIDYVLINDEPIPDEISLKYEEDEAEPVYMQEDDVEFCNRHGIKIINGHFLDLKSGYVRHDGVKLSKEIVDLYRRKL